MVTKNQKKIIHIFMQDYRSDPNVAVGPYMKRLKLGRNYNKFYSLFFQVWCEGTKKTWTPNLVEKSKDQRGVSQEIDALLGKHAK